MNKFLFVKKWKKSGANLVIFLHILKENLSLRLQLPGLKDWQECPQLPFGFFLQI